MKPKNTPITKIDEDADIVRTFHLDMDWLHSFDPGQYLMIWVRGSDEIPMSLSGKNAVTVQRVGDTTEQLFKLKEGDTVGVRGPYGNGFQLKGKHILIVAGGVGIAPLTPLIEQANEQNIKTTIVLGAQNQQELIFTERLSGKGELHICTDDGSAGYCGFATDRLDGIDLNAYDQIYTCGPEPMMYNLLERCREQNIENKLQISMQRYVKCGLGLCGSCCIDPSGMRVCVDGPVFTGEQLMDTDFGVYQRDASGRRNRF